MNEYGQFSKSRFYREVRKHRNAILKEINQKNEEQTVSQSVDIPNQDLVVESDEDIKDNEELQPDLEESDEYKLSDDEDDQSNFFDHYNLFPLTNEIELESFEKKLLDHDFRAKVVKFCKRLKAEKSTKFNAAFQYIIKDELSSKYNYSGVCGKKPFKDLEVAKMMFDAWKGPLIGKSEFVKELTKVLKLGRNRAHKKQINT